MEMLAMVHLPKREVVTEKQPMSTCGDFLCVQPDTQSMHNARFITPETSVVSSAYMETERFCCPEHGPYVIDRNGEMGGCLGCNDVKLNISMSRDCSYDDLDDESILDLVLEANHDGEDSVMTGINFRSRFEATKGLFDFMFAYEAAQMQKAAAIVGGGGVVGDIIANEEDGKNPILHNYIINSAAARAQRSPNRSPMKECAPHRFPPLTMTTPAPGKLVRVASKDDFAISYKEENQHQYDLNLFMHSLQRQHQLQLFGGVGGGSAGVTCWERSRSVPENLDVLGDNRDDDDDDYDFAHHHQGSSTGSATATANKLWESNLNQVVHAT